MANTNTPFHDVDSRVNVNDLEHNILSYWEENQIFAKSLEKTKDGKPFSFYDGPPYATGKPHYGHVLQSSLKDTVLRFKTMRGYHVPRRVGWDTHGLPVEVIVERELGLKNKQDIEEYGIEKFNAKCRQTVVRYVDLFTATLKRLGRWADYEGAYFTMDIDFMESEWWAFKELWNQKLIYKAFRSTPYCIRCATPLSNFETGMSYQDTTDTALYVLLPVVGEKNLYLVVWTTTPWTLPGNIAVAISPDLSYVTVAKDGKNLVMAGDRAGQIVGQDSSILKKWKTAELTALKYQPPYSFDQVVGAHRVVVGEHVTGEDGTGLVHIAPAFGEEDFVLAKKFNLPTIKNVDTKGRFTRQVKPWAGENIFAANKKIVAELEERGLLLSQEQHTHNYPYCWRCDTPLIYYALDSWFVKVQEIKNRMLEINADINWIPAHIKKGRFAKGIESAPDWAVSRNRFWSVPIPVWQCEDCEAQVCIGSLQELKDLSGVKDIADLHRPFVDEITWSCSSCTGVMKRTPEVLDVWFDAGSMPYAQWHYPFENEKLVEQTFPADFIVEAIEMTRAWFYTLHVLAVALKDSPAYRNVIGSGIIFGSDGNKLSKKLKNYPKVEPTLEKFGADTLRLFFLNSTLGEPYVFSEAELKQLHRSLYQTLWNVYSFFVLYANMHAWSPGEKTISDHLLDKWIIARLTKLEHKVISSADAYQVDQAARAFGPFVDDLSNWYVRRSRERFQRPASPQEKDQAFSTLHDVLVRTARLLAPFMPFVTEEIYRNLTGGESVHLEQLADSKKPSVDTEKLLSQMKAAREIVSEGLALRAKAGIKVRQPLASLTTTTKLDNKDIIPIVRDELNVKELKFADTLPAGQQYALSKENDRVQVALDLKLSAELKQEGIAREIIRHGQVLRRQAGFKLDERIILSTFTSDTKLAAVLRSYREIIADALQADQIVEHLDQADTTADLKIDGASIHVGVAGKKPKS